MCAVLGNLIVEGCIVKIAEDLYCFGETPEKEIGRKFYWYSQTPPLSLNFQNHYRSEVNLNPWLEMAARNPNCNQS